MNNPCFFIILVTLTINFHMLTCERRNSIAKDELKQSNIYIGAPASLVNHTQEFKKQIITVLPGVHCAVGYAIANTILIEGTDGNIIIDTLESRETAIEVRADFERISTKPVVGIIYTHNHADHVNGAEIFAGSNLKNVKIYSHSKTRQIIDVSSSLLEPINFQRSARQFGRYLTEATGHINNGVGLSSKYTNSSTRGLLYPTDTFDSDKWNLTIAGREFIFYYAPGETDDQIVVYMPKERILFAADNVYKAFPNIYSIRGTTTRDALQWVSSLDLMRNLRPEYLVPSHTKPISGVDYIYDVLTKYRDGIQFVHDQTVRFMNEGATPDEIIGNKLIQLPKQLQEHPYLQQFYGTVDWTIRAIFDRYMGWFSGKTSGLNPDPPSIRAQNLIRLGGGSKNVLASAKKAFLKQRYQWCLELTEALQHQPEDLNMSDINELQASSLRKLASFQTSANGRNWYLTRALEVQGVVNIKRSPVQKAQSILRSPLTNSFMLLSVNFNYKSADGVDQLVLFRFNDTNDNFSVHIRNGIADVKNQWPENVLTDEIDMIIEVKERRVWQEVLARVKSSTSALSNGEIMIKYANGKIHLTGELKLIEFLNMFAL